MPEVDGQLELPFEDLPEPVPFTPDATTAFLVIVDLDGTAYATADLATPMVVDHNASLAEMRRACQEVITDITAQHTAQRVVAALKDTGPSPAQRVSRRLAERRST